MQREVQRLISLQDRGIAQLTAEYGNETFILHFAQRTTRVGAPIAGIEFQPQPVVAEKKTFRCLAEIIRASTGMEKRNLGLVAPGGHAVEISHEQAFSRPGFIESTI